MEATLEPLGHDVGILFPRPVLDALKWRAGQKVRLECLVDGLSIRPSRPRYTLAELVAQGRLESNEKKAPRDWEEHAECKLRQPDSPSVITRSSLRMLVTTGRSDAPSPAMFGRWVAAMTFARKLQEVTRNVYLNVMAHSGVRPAAASHWVRSRSCVSLSWVLGQAHVTNNFGDTVTCIIGIEDGLPKPHIGDRQTTTCMFRFFAMPMRLVDRRAGCLEDIQDLRFDYPRTTPEKALLDWIYLGASPRSRMTRPPYDIDVETLNAPRLFRLANTMGLTDLLNDWLAHYERYQADVDVRENSATRLRL